jgi:rubrerythrin
VAELHRTTSCEQCGYDLRGISSKLCPECGGPIDFLIVRIVDPQQFHFARAALEKENLVSRFINPGGSMGINAEITGDRSGWLWVRSDAADRAEEIFDDLGIVTSLGARPIVDRAEPVCPKCEHKLDVNGPETCPACNAEFDWIEVGSEPLDPTGHLCHSCGYELTGNTSGHCPECGRSVFASVFSGGDSPLESPVNPAANEPSVPSRVMSELFLFAACVAASMCLSVIASVAEPVVARIFLHLVSVFAFLFGSVRLAIWFGRWATRA